MDNEEGHYTVIENPSFNCYGNVTNNNGLYHLEKDDSGDREDGRPVVKNYCVS